MMHFGSFGTGFGGFGLGWIFMVLIWVFVILGVIYLIKQIFSGKEITTQIETAEDILKKRYAAGEIAKEEYDGKLRAISG
jgi:putative membrane protein